MEQASSPLVVDDRKQARLVEAVKLSEPKGEPMGTVVDSIPSPTLLDLEEARVPDVKDNLTLGVKVSIILALLLNKFSILSV